MPGVKPSVIEFAGKGLSMVATTRYTRIEFIVSSKLITVRYDKLSEQFRDASATHPTIVKRNPNQASCYLWLANNNFCTFRIGNLNHHIGGTVYREAIEEYKASEARAAKQNLFL